MNKNINLKIILLAAICLTGFFGFVFEVGAYSNVALNKGVWSSNPNPWGWGSYSVGRGLTDGVAVSDWYQETITWQSYTYATDSSGGFPKDAIIYLGSSYDVDLVKLYKEWGPDSDGITCEDPFCLDGPCGCAYCSRNNSNTRTIQVYSRNGGGSWNYWGEQTFSSGPGGSLDWNRGSKILADEILIRFINTWYQWRTGGSCACPDCGSYVFLREAEVFGDPPCSPNCNDSGNYCSGTSYTGNCGQTCTGTKNCVPPPTASCSVSPNPTPWGGNPGITLNSTNGYYCHVYHDWSEVQSGYFGSGTYYPGAQTTPGVHTAEVYCYNSNWVGSGWNYCSYTVSPRPTCSLSVSPNPVPWGGNPGFTLSSTNGYYCHVLMDGVWDWNASGYFTSGTYYPGAQTVSGNHSAWCYCYNSVWQNPNGWSITPFTVSPRPTGSITLNVSPSGAGTATVDIANYYLNDGVNSSASASANAGYSFVGWDTDGNGSINYSNNPLAINHSQSWNITAIFSLNPPTCSLSVLPNPVPYNGNPGFTLSSTNGYYCYVLEDGSWAWYVAGYFTSGTYYPGAQTVSGAHSAWCYCYNSNWIGSGWSVTPFTVNPAPIAGACNPSYNHTNQPSSLDLSSITNLCNIPNTPDADTNLTLTGSRWTWICPGLNGGAPASCWADKCVEMAVSWTGGCSANCGGGSQDGTYQDAECHNHNVVRACNSQPCPPSYKEVAPW